jgi:hypothetical protein
MKVMKDLECIIMYCGEPTYDYCLQSVKTQTIQPKRIIRIDNVSPISESINARHEAMELPFSVKVDSDMILYPECFEILYKALKNWPDEKTKKLSRELNIPLRKRYAATGMLKDPFIGIMGAVHMEKTELVRSIIVEDVIGCDRFVREKMKKRGYHIHEIESVMGEHWCDWSDEAIFKRHVRVGQKHFYYRDRHHNDWIRNIGRSWIEKKEDSAFLALLGYCYGLLNPDDREKDLNFMNDEWAAVVELMHDKVIPKAKQIWSLKK